MTRTDHMIMIRGSPFEHVARSYFTGAAVLGVHFARKG